MEAEDAQQETCLAQAIDPSCQQQVDQADAEESEPVSDVSSGAASTTGSETDLSVASGDHSVAS